MRVSASACVRLRVILYLVENTDIELLKSLLAKELGYLPGGDGIDALLRRGQLMDFRGGEAIIEAGCNCPDVYIVKDGIVRFIDMNGDKERTFAFAMAGTIFMSKHSFVMSRPSYYSVEACCQTELLRISRDDFWNVVEEYKEVALWMLRYAYGELFYQEHKNAAVHNGSARERYENMFGDRPEIIEKVPQKIIASYLGVTPEYFSRLKKEYFHR